MSPEYNALERWVRQRELSAVNRKASLLLGRGYLVLEIPGTENHLTGSAVALYEHQTLVDVANNPQSMSTRIDRIARAIASTGTHGLRIVA